MNERFVVVDDFAKESKKKRLKVVVEKFNSRQNLILSDHAINGFALQGC